MKSQIDAAERAVKRCQTQHLNADSKYRDAIKNLISSENSGIRVIEAKAKLENAKTFLDLSLERLEKAREELSSLNVRAIEDEDNGKMYDSGDDWSDTPVFGSAGGALSRVRSVSGESRDNEGVDEEKDHFIENNCEPDENSKEEDSLFLEDSEYTENKEENASFQGEFILIIPAKLDDPILIIDERQKYNESKEEIERILLENQEVKILYEDFSYNALLIEHVLKAPTSVTLFGDINYEEILLQA
jgi:hypothetical protein